MKTTSITVERNFHIMNDDRFIMEKISMTADTENSDPIWVTDELRKQIIENFKAAYPHIEESMNFHVVRQVGINGNAKSDFGSQFPSDAKFNSRNDNNVNLPTAIPDKATIIEEMKFDVEGMKDKMNGFKKSAALFLAVYGEYKNHNELGETFRNKLEELKSNKQSV